MSGYEALHSNVARIDLPGRALIRVTGEDRARLLHAMSTNDINHLDPGKGLYAFFLNAQGRILADAYIWNLGDSFILDSEPELRQKLFEHLDKYIIADDVVLEDASDTYRVIALEGPNSLDHARKLDLTVPEHEHELAPIADGFIARVSSAGRIGVRLFLHRASSSKLEKLLDETPLADGEATLAVRLENGRPRYGSEISERFLVQETGILSAVHFSKGCYLGQEIVERVRSRAQVHRHLKQVVLETTEIPAVGAKLQLADGKDGAEIVSAAYSPGRRSVVAFAYVRTEGLTEQLTLKNGESAISVPAQIV